MLCGLENKVAVLGLKWEEGGGNACGLGCLAMDGGEISVGLILEPM